MRYDEQLVEIIDVEKVLAEIVPYNAKVSREKLADPIFEQVRGREVLLVDDSSVALAQLRETLSQLGVKMHIASDGLKALNMLKGWADTGQVMTDKLLMIFTDASGASGLPQENGISDTGGSTSPGSGGNAGNGAGIGGGSTKDNGGSSNGAGVTGSGDDAGNGNGGNSTENITNTTGSSSLPGIIGAVVCTLIFLHFHFSRNTLLTSMSSARCSSPHPDCSDLQIQAHTPCTILPPQVHPLQDRPIWKI